MSINIYDHLLLEST